MMAAERLLHCFNTLYRKIDCCPLYNSLLDVAYSILNSKCLALFLDIPSECPSN